MKRVIFILAVLPLLFAGCSKDEEPAKFDYDLNLLYGEWRVSHIWSADGDYVDVTSGFMLLIFEPTYATFNPNGTYSGSGHYGDGSGTYTAVGKTITTYISGQEFVKYDVIGLSGSTCELRMYGSGYNTKIKCKKQNR
jgi:hypothetical protein